MSKLNEAKALIYCWALAFFMVFIGSCGKGKETTHQNTQERTGYYDTKAIR